jgi:PadR family transcriptional regulator, regulatory protein PadR
MKSQTLKGHLDLLLLAILDEEPAHGYAVIEALDERSDGEFDLPEGTVYPALHRLEKAGLLDSEWSVVGGRRRRTYAISTKGRAALTEQASAWDQFSSAVARVLGARTAKGEASWA